MHKYFLKIAVAISLTACNETNTNLQSNNTADTTVMLTKSQKNGHGTFLENNGLRI